MYNLCEKFKIWTKKLDLFFLAISTFLIVALDAQQNCMPTKLLYRSIYGIFVTTKVDILSLNAIY